MSYSAEAEDSEFGVKGRVVGGSSDKIIHSGASASAERAHCGVVLDS